LSEKKAVILVEDDFEDAELLEPLKTLKAAGLQVKVIGAGNKRSYRGKRGTSIETDASAEEVGAADFDVIVVPGGYAPDKMRLHSSMVDLVRSANDQGKIIAAVCHGPQLLISAGVVKGRRVTSWPSVAVDLRNAGATWIDEPVVIDRNVITSRKQPDLPAFAQAILDALVQRDKRISSRETEEAVSSTTAERGNPQS